jgi:hypothetical protein
MKSATAGTTMASTGAHVYPNEVTLIAIHSWRFFSVARPALGSFESPYLGNRRAGKHNAFKVHTRECHVTSRLRKFSHGFLCQRDIVSEKS